MTITNPYDSEQSIIEHHKAFINYISALAKLHSDRVMARYCFNGEFKPLTYAEVDRISTNLACTWASNLQEVEVVSFISEHSISFMITMLALLKLRVTMFAVSPRSSEAAIVHMLEKTQSKLLISNVKYESISKSAAAQIDGVKVITVQPLDIETLLQEPLHAGFETILDFNFTKDDIEKTAIIIHSSGSTAFPKPVHISNRYLFRMARTFSVIVNSSEGVASFNENDSILNCTPLFYVYGYLTCFATINFGGCVVFVERLPPSAQEIVQAIKTNKTTLLSASPLVLEQMISYLQETNDYSIADHLKLVLVGGAPLKPESGDWLLSHGINIRNGYGSTETGHVLISDFNQKSRNWNSLRPLLKDSQGVYYAMFETNDVSEPDVKHLYLRGGCPTLATHISNRLDGGYDTNDLFKEHPDYPGYYVYLCRRDDILVMENGEKTNPIPMEAMIRQSPVVKQVVVLGQGRRCTAALIQIDMQHALKLNPNQINASVHEAVKKANISCPKHSTVLPQMVWILPFNKTLPSTDKGTVMRKKAAAEYADVIEKLYKDFIEGTSHCATDISVDVSTWSIEGIESFLVDCASEVLQVPRSNFVNHSQSIFDLGFNSLSAIQLRNLIAKRFNYISQNFLFEYPTIASMQKALMSSLKEDPSAQIEKRYQQTQDLAHYYIKKAEIDFPVACKRYDGKKDIVVLLTGATGSLGSFMLRDMLRNTCVKKIYCCVRGSKEQLHQRLVEAFESRCLDVSLLNTSRIEALPMAFNEPFLGISKERYHQLKQEITVIQHSAWLLNFNLPIDHFDKECIAPFYNLLKFAYRETNPMHVHFISSVSANASLGSEIAEEPLPLNAHVAMPIGYSQSKFVVEVLLNYLTSEKNFPCYIERLGQVCGDSVNGVWNTSEQFPLMFIGGGSIMHKMPNLDITIDWIPVDAASVSIVNIMLRTAFLPADQDQFIYHIVNPCTVTWTSVLGAMRDSGMDFEIVSPSEWIESLLQDGTNPAYRLVSFYEASFKGFKMPIYKTIESSALSPLINQSPVLDATLFRKFLAYWKSVGFYA